MYKQQTQESNGEKPDRGARVERVHAVVSVVGVIMSEKIKSHQQ